jgi:hypothetical protein
MLPNGKSGKRVPFRPPRARYLARGGSGGRDRKPEQAERPQAVVVEDTPIVVHVQINSVTRLQRLARKRSLSPHRLPLGTAKPLWVSEQGAACAGARRKRPMAGQDDQCRSQSACSILVRTRMRMVRPG